MWQLDGFIEESVYEQVDENGNIAIISIAAWESYDKLVKAKGAMEVEFSRIGFNPKKFREELRITMERGAYTKKEDPPPKPR